MLDGEIVYADGQHPARVLQLITEHIHRFLDPHRARTLTRRTSTWAIQNLLQDQPLVSDAH